jgi:hypothetical protein
MGKMIKTRNGWQIWPTPFAYRRLGAAMFGPAARHCKGARLRHNQRRVPRRRT